MVYHEAENTKNITQHQKKCLKQTKIMQIRSRDLTAPQSFKISFKKKWAHFLARVILLYYPKKIQNVSRYKTVLGNFQISHLF